MTRYSVAASLCTASLGLEESVWPTVLRAQRLQNSGTCSMIVNIMHCQRSSMDIHMHLLRRKWGGRALVIIKPSPKSLP